MHQDSNQSYQRWQAAESAQDDEAADAAFGALYSSAMPAPLPSRELAGKTMAAVAAVKAAQARRARLIRTSLRWLGLPAAVVIVYFGAGTLVSLLSSALVGTLNLLVSAVVMFADGSDARRTTWSVLAGLGRATAALVDDPRVTLAMLVCQATAVVALVALHRPARIRKGVAQMRTLIASLVLATALLGGAEAQELRPEDQALRERIQERYDVVPLTDGIALRPQNATAGVRLIEVSDTISINGVVVTGRELRERVGADADAILKLSYLDPVVRRALFAPPAVAAPAEPDPALIERPDPAGDGVLERTRQRSGSDRVRIFGDVSVREDEHITGEVVAVMGSVRVDGEVGETVVAVMGSVDLGEKAIVHGDVVSVGGRVRRAPGAQVRGAVTDISFADGRWNGRVVPWVGTIGMLSLFDGFGAFPRLIGTTFRLLLLLFFASIAMILARSSVEGSAQRVSDNPIKATIVGLVAELMFVPVLVLICIVLGLSIVGIPLLLLVPFAVLFVLVLALIGFTGAALAVGQWARRRFRLGSPGGFADIWLGILIIVLPVLLGRLIGLAGFLGGPFAFMLVAAGVALEFLVWATGLGAVLANTVGRWQARRVVRTASPVVN